MHHRRLRTGGLLPLIMLLLLSALGPASAQDTVAAGPGIRELFAAEVPIEFTLEADFPQLKNDRDEESEERPGRMLLAGPMGVGGDPIAIDVKLRTRGNFRLQKQYCAFPPLRLNLPKGDLVGTVLDGQDKLKLVDHCQDRDAYEQNVLEEYLAYRLYNLLTDRSFQVRLARVTYLDTTAKDDPVTRMAFLVEGEDAMAARLDGTLLEVPAVGSEDYEPVSLGRVYLFQFLIGNEDWSVTHFHNIGLLRVGTSHYPIPYDFDWSGLVDAPYAEPHEEYADRIRTVRERLFSGACSDRIDYGALFAEFNEKRPAIEALIAGQVLLSERNRESALDYIEEFYRIINDQRRAEREILRACIGG